MQNFRWLGAAVFLMCKVFCSCRNIQVYLWKTGLYMTFLRHSLGCMYPASVRRIILCLKHLVLKIAF